MQIVQADVTVRADGETLIEEPLCIDVGLPALLASAAGEGADPDPGADAAVEWRRMPFFVCGCGDPDCRAFAFKVTYEGETVVWTEAVRSAAGMRNPDQYRFPLAEYRAAALAAGIQFLSFMEGRSYKPLQPRTMQLVEHYVEALRSVES